jgi:ubiquinone/menaquinone biosynthesis C-methylase UbiE
MGFFMQKSFETYRFENGQTIASIGASSGVWEVWYASHFNDITFYLQDIDANNCNDEEVKYAVNYYEKLLNKPITAQFFTVIGQQNNTNLPHNIFDKVLIINTLHELDFAKEILLDCYQLLKKKGVLYIEEQLASKIGEIHEGCLKPLLLSNQLLILVQSCGFVLEEITDKDNHVKIFSFLKG